MRFSPLIDVESLRQLLADDGAAVVLDCRFDLGDPSAGRQAFLTAHIPGARYADLNKDLAGPVGPDTGRHPLPSPQALCKFLGSLGIGAVIAYDDANGAIAARAWWLLRWLGRADVAVLDGGFKAWLRAGGAVEAGEPDAVADPLGDADARARPGMLFRQPLTASGNATAVVSAAEVLRALGDPARMLVDARAAERFAGRVEPLDAVAGHVPGAVNHPFTLNLAADGRFLPRPELRRRWLELLAGMPPSNVTVMCGSGVTACQNLLAMDAAGLHGAKLYPGSWSEWIRDPDRPVARAES